MELLKKTPVKYLIVAVVIMAFICAILLVPIIMADFPKKWTYYGVACLAAGIITFGTLMLADFLSGTGNSSSSSRLLGGYSHRPNNNVVSTKIDDLFS